METMPSSLPVRSTRLENLRLSADGAAFDLDGRSVQLAAEHYSAPVAAMQAFHQLALADYRARSAELSRLAAAERPSVFRRVLSWAGGFIGRLIPGRHPAAPADPGARPIAITPEPPAETFVPRRAENAPAAREAARPPEAALPAAGSWAKAGPLPPPPAVGAGVAALQTLEVSAPAPTLHVAFADRDGVHVIWQLAAIRSDPGQSREAAGAKTAPRLELTYGLDSAMGRRLQDCYGQLAQLGYKIAGLESVRPMPEKAALERGAKAPPADAVIILPPPAPLEPSPGSEREKPPEPKTTGRKPRAEAAPPRAEPAKPIPEGPAPEAGLLPGI